MGVNVGKPDVLIKLDEENGKLTYGGVPVCDGEHSGSGDDTPLPAVRGTVALVDNFSELDPEAEDGSLALAWNPNYQTTALELGTYDADEREYLIPNKLVSFAPEMEYRESVYTHAIQNFLSKYPLQYRQYWGGATFDTYCLQRGVFRLNANGTYTDISSTFSIGDDISGYYYADRDRCFYLEAELRSTHKDWSVWDRECMLLSAVPVVTDAKDNIFVRERVECEGILCDGVIAPQATTKYLVAAMWEGDAMHRTFLELFPGATKVGGNVYRVPLVFLYSFEDMDASLEYEQDDDSDKGYHMETASFHLQAGWNVVYVIGAMQFDPKDKEWELENVAFDSVEPVDTAPSFSVQTDETGTVEFWRENADLLFEGMLQQKKETHPSGLYIKTENWQPIHAGMLPRIDVDKYSHDIDVLYERVDETINDLEDNPPYHSNRYVLDALSEDNGTLMYNGSRIRTISSIDLDGQYNGFDSYRINFTDGTQEYFNILHTKNTDVSTMHFNFSRPADEDRMTVYFNNGDYAQIPFSGFDFNLAFQGEDSGGMLHQGRQFGDRYAYFKFGSWADYGEFYPLCVNISDLDRNTAKLDYIDMMMGTGFETEGLYDRAQRNYTAGYWNADHLRQAVAHGWIGTDDFQNMTGMPYDDSDDEPYDDPDDEPYDDPDDEPDDNWDDEPDDN
ncbi:MAG: XkdX family protein [Clostridia bacterium]|nr:XkdX family protein [Clostridia bacterium]